ncbi:MAG: DMT family transporter [Nitratireductor sp.]
MITAPILTNKTWAMLILLATIWGGSFLFGRIAVQEVPVFSLVFLRVGLAAIALWAFILITKRKFQFTKWLIINCFIIGILNNVIPFSFILYGQKEIGAGLASVVNAMTPIWTLLIANWFTQDEKINPIKLTGISLGFLGVAILMGTDIWLGLKASALAQFMVVLATISYGASGVFGKRFKSVDPLLIAACQLTTSTLILLPVMFIMEDPLQVPLPSAPAIFSILAIALLCTAYAYVLFFKILNSAGAVNVSLVTLLVPISAILLGMLFLDEALHWHQLGGLLIIMLGLIIIDGRTIKRLRRKKIQEQQKP